MSMGSSETCLLSLGHKEIFLLGYTSWPYIVKPFVAEHIRSSSASRQGGNIQ